MKNKLAKPPRQGILRTGVIIPITDPTEQADLDRRCREADRALTAGRANAPKAKLRKGK